MTAEDCALVIAYVELENEELEPLEDDEVDPRGTARRRSRRRRGRRSNSATEEWVIPLDE
jgi:hypothetical protein